jgi:hypothetical protein
VPSFNCLNMFREVSLTYVHVTIVHTSSVHGLGFPQSSGVSSLRGRWQNCCREKGQSFKRGTSQSELKGTPKASIRIPKTGRFSHKWAIEKYIKESEARVRAQVNPHGIGSGQSGSGTGFSSRSSAFSINNIPLPFSTLIYHTEQGWRNVLSASAKNLYNFRRNYFACPWEFWAAK